MQNLFEKLLELADLVKKENETHKEELPTSERFLKYAASNFADTPERIAEWIKLLHDANIIFIINLVHPDPKHQEMKGIDSYVYADKPMLEMLKSAAEKKLEKAYEATYYKKASPTSIERELFPQIKTLNNTPMGKVLHEYVTLRNSLMMVDSKPELYTEERQKSRLKELLQDYGGDTSGFEPDVEEVEIVESHEPQKKKIEEIDINPHSPWGRLSRRYSTDILLKVHFRKYEFSVIKKLVKTSRIKNREVLRFIMDEAMKMEKEADTNHIIKMKLDELIELRRFVQARLNLMKREELEKAETVDLADDEILSEEI